MFTQLSAAGSSEGSGERFCVRGINLKTACKAFEAAKTGRL